MDDLLTKQIAISEPTEVITLSAEDDFSEVFAHNLKGELIGSFKFWETEEGALHLQWMFLDKIHSHPIACDFLGWLAGDPT